MIEENNKKEYEIYLCQLNQLNERSRWYANRFWHLPFAYITVVGIILALVNSDQEQLSNKYGMTFETIYILIGFMLFFFGVAILGLMAGTRNAIDCAVESLKLIERELGLRPTSDKSNTIQTKTRRNSIDFFNWAIIAIGQSSILLLTLRFLYTEWPLWVIVLISVMVVILLVFCFWMSTIVAWKRMKANQNITKKTKKTKKTKNYKN